MTAEDTLNSRVVIGVVATLCLLIVMTIPGTPRCEDARFSFDSTITSVGLDGEKPEQLYVKRVVKYGKVMFVIDGVSAAFALIGQASDNTELSGLGLAGYILGGPLVHAGKGNSHKGWWSLGTRLVLPAIGSHVLAAFAPCKSCRSHEISGVLGAVGGAIGAMAIDQIYFAKKTEFHEYRSASQSSWYTAAEPMVTMGPAGEMTVGMVGRF